MELCTLSDETKQKIKQRLYYISANLHYDCWLAAYKKSKGKPGINYKKPIQWYPSMDATEAQEIYRRSYNKLIDEWTKEDEEIFKAYILKIRKLHKDKDYTIDYRGLGL